jgi:hypothetical protein
VNKKNTHTSRSFNLEPFSCLVACVVTRLQQIADCLYLPVWFSYPFNVLYAVCDTYPCTWTCTFKVSNWNEIVIWSRIQSGNCVPVTHTCISALSKQANELISRSASSRLCLFLGPVLSPYRNVTGCKPTAWLRMCERLVQVVIYEFDWVTGFGISRSEYCNSFFNRLNGSPVRMVSQS